MAARPPVDAAPRRRRDWDGLLALLGALLIFAAYARALRGDFLWDDDAHITANPTIVGPLGLKEIWTSGKANYFPLTMTSFWVQHALWGLAPLGYHVVTILFHVATALVLWRVLVRLAIPGAWLGAMLWALHPVQVESVAWICELKNTQSGFFYTLAIYCFVRWLQHADTPRGSWHYGAALLAAVAAILSKSSTVMLPLVLALIAWWQGRRRWREAWWLAPFFVVSLGASAWTIWEQKVNSMASGVDWDQSLAARLLIAGKVPWFYLEKLLWPQPLIFIYPRWDVHAQGLLPWLPLLATIAGVALVWRGRAGPGRSMGLALAYFGVSLFPVLGLFDVFFFKYSFVGDHFQYLASMGPLVLAGAGLAAWAPRAPAAAALLLGSFALLTWQRTAVYRNREMLWADTVARNPGSWIGQMNLGAEYLTSGRAPLAVPHFAIAARLRVGDALAETNWGAALHLSGKSAEAMPHLEHAIRLKPDLAEAHHTLGVVLMTLNRPGDAIPRFAEALRLKPDFVTARLDLGNAYFRAQRPAEAIPQYEAAVAAVPQDAVPRRNLGSALFQAGRLPEAIQRYRESLQLDPNSVEAWSNLGLAFSQAGQRPAAIAAYEEVLRREPQNAGALEQLKRLRGP